MTIYSQYVRNLHPLYTQYGCKQYTQNGLTSTTKNFTQEAFNCVSSVKFLNKTYATGTIVAFLIGSVSFNLKYK